MSLAGLLEPHATVTVAGLAKNAGKTTVMNHLLASLGGRSAWRRWGWTVRPATS